MRIVPALTERCDGRTRGSIYEVFEYHSREGRRAIEAHLMTDLHFFNRCVYELLFVPCFIY